MQAERHDFGFVVVGAALAERGHDPRDALTGEDRPAIVRLRPFLGERENDEEQQHLTGLLVDPDVAEVGLVQGDFETRPQVVRELHSPDDTAGTGGE